MGLFSDKNHIELRGNVTADPEVKRTPSGTHVATINVATNRTYKQGDEWKEEVQYTRVVLWGKLAEHAAERVIKGTRLIIEGRLQTRAWNDKDGNKRYSTEVIADDMVLLDRYNKKDGQQHSRPSAEQEDNSDAYQGQDVIDPDDLPF